jgi:hypothetical protein
VADNNQSEFTGSKKNELLASPELRRDYGFLTAPGKTPGSSALGDIAGGTVIILSPQDGLVDDGGRKTPYDRMVDAAVPTGHPYNERLKALPDNDPMKRLLGRQAFLNSPDDFGPHAHHLPHLQRLHDDVSVITMPSREGYRDFKGGLYGAFSGVGDAYPVQRSADDELLMAQMVIHELKHNDDGLSHGQQALAGQVLKTEADADCAAYAAAQDPKIAAALQISPASRQEYADARATASLLVDTGDGVSHATTFADAGNGTCSRDFSQAASNRAAHQLINLHGHIDKEIGGAYARDAMAALSTLDERTMYQGTPQDREMKHHLYQQVYNPVEKKIDETRVDDLFDRLERGDDKTIKELGNSVRHTDPALVYGAVQKINATKGGGQNLSDDQQHYIDRFRDAADRRYPTMKDSPLVDKVRDAAPMDPAVGQTVMNGYRAARQEYISTRSVMEQDAVPAMSEPEPQDRKVELQGLGR